MVAYPPPFAFEATPSMDAKDVKGQVVIKGGEQFETAGDTVTMTMKLGYLTGTAIFLSVLVLLVVLAVIAARQPARLP